MVSTPASPSLSPPFSFGACLPLLPSLPRNHDEAMSRLQSFPRSMHPLVLILDNVRSAYNVGSLFRTAETALLQELITCGFTPHPPHEKLKKTACRSLENVPSRHFSTTLDAVRTMKEEGFVVFAMETTSRSQCYTHVAFPEKAALVLGRDFVFFPWHVWFISDPFRSLCPSFSCHRRGTPS